MPLGHIDDWEPLPKPLTRGTLDEVGCGNPECDCKPGSTPMILGSRCHPGAGTDAFYFDGILSLRCHECKDAITVIEVAK